MTDEQRAAKAAFLDNQQAQMLEHYQSISDAERADVIKHIDSLLEVLKGDEKEFWLTFRERLTTVSITPHPLAAMRNIENARLFIDELMAETSNSQWVVDGMILLLSAISRNYQDGENCLVDSMDFCDAVIRHLYSNWSTDYSRAERRYIEKAKAKTAADY